MVILLDDLSQILTNCEYNSVKVRVQESSDTLNCEFPRTFSFRLRQMERKMATGFG